MIERNSPALLFDIPFTCIKGTTGIRNARGLQSQLRSGVCLMYPSQGNILVTRAGDDHQEPIQGAPLTIGSEVSGDPRFTSRQAHLKNNPRPLSRSTLIFLNGRVSPFIRVMNIQ
ncbi:MAG: hypothetical protein BWX87_02430 [Bacteroidetes bacterium ADurb.Bin123]|nr:MAG: hypothetical protein BWX87_02430 [Bacteroidetes bacterium ADurb.Bin123]